MIKRDDLHGVVLSMEQRITAIEDFINKHDFSMLKEAKKECEPNPSFGTFHPRSKCKTGGSCSLCVDDAKECKHESDGSSWYKSIYEGVLGYHCASHVGIKGSIDGLIYNKCKLCGGFYR